MMAIKFIHLHDMETQIIIIIIIYILQHLIWSQEAWLIQDTNQMQIELIRGVRFKLETTLL